jgi:hypothetical protein
VGVPHARKLVRRRGHGVAWDRVLAWRSMPLDEFRTDFAAVVQRADRVQPRLLVVAIVASFAFGLPMPERPGSSP